MIDLPGGRPGAAAAGLLGGRDAAMNQIISETKALLAAVPDEEPDERAELLLTLGNAYYRRQGESPAEDFETAVVHLRESRRLRTRRDGAGWVRSTLALAAALRHRVLGDLEENQEEALGLFREALTVAEAEGLDSDAASVKVSMGLALTFRRRGDTTDNLAEAIRLFREAEEIFTRDATPGRWAVIETNLATALLKVAGPLGCGGDPDALAGAAVAAQNALEVFALGEAAAHRRRAANTAAQAQARLGRWREAAALYLVATEAAETLATATGAVSRKELADGSNAPFNAAYCLARAGDAEAATNVVELARRRLRHGTSAGVALVDIVGERPLDSAVLAAASAVGAVLYVVPTTHGTVGLLVRGDRDDLDPPAVEIVELDVDTAALRDVLALPPTGDGRGGHARGSLAAAGGGAGPILTSPLEAIGALEQLLSPIAELVRDCQGVLVISCGALGIMPLHSNWLGSNDEPEPDRRRFLFVPCASDHQRVAARPSGPVTRLLTIGVGSFAGAKQTLRYSEAEAAAVAAMYDDSEILVGRRARPDEILDRVRWATAVHIATHGEFAPGDPSRTGIWCADGSFLSFTEMFSTNATGLQLVTSTACWSGLHESLYLPDEVDGPCTAMLDLGVRGVVAPVWDVDDLDAALFMVKLHDLMTGGRSAAAATLSAQRWLRDADRQDRLAMIHAHGLAVAGPTRPEGSGGDTWASFRFVGADSVTS